MMGAFTHNGTQISATIRPSLHVKSGCRPTTMRHLTSSPGWALTGVNSRAPQGDGAEQEKPEHLHHPSAQEVEERVRFS